MEFTLNSEECASLVEAARQAGMARAAYTAQAVLTAAANDQPAGGQDPLELIRE